MFRFIDAEKACHHVATLCRVLGVSRSGFYAWKTRPPSHHRLRDLELARAIERVHAVSEM